MRRKWLGILLLLGCSVAGAAELRVNVADQRGRPVDGAVVTVRPQGDPATRAQRSAPLTKTIDQSALAFVPYIQVFRPGDKVVFRNSDKTRHHVYSFSPVKAFEFMLTPGESSTPLELDKSGVVAVGCNIHDLMITYLYVSDAPWIDMSSATGEASFKDLSPGTYTVRVWHPRLRPGKPDLVQSGVVVPAADGKSLGFSLVLLPDSRRQFDREQTQY